MKTYTVKEMLDNVYYVMPHDDTVRGMLGRTHDIVEFCYRQGFEPDAGRLKKLLNSISVSYTEFCGAYHGLYVSIYDECEKRGLMDNEAK